jgi:hypothetical protein
MQVLGRNVSLKADKNTLLNYTVYLHVLNKILLVY